jgi:hypothetical protein
MLFMPGDEGYGRGEVAMRQGDAGADGGRRCGGDAGNDFERDPRGGERVPF